MLAIVDYKAGNQTSVRRALAHLGIPCQITANPQALLEADGVIFPGVGAAGQAMGQLRESGLDQALCAVVKAGKPLLGICLGCQIMLDHSDENNISTLGLIPGRCRRFDSALTDDDGRVVRIPHMGWNTLSVLHPSPLLAGIALDAAFYFVHSYYVEPAPESVIAISHHGMDFCAVFGCDGLWAVQFHPEKSGRPGLQVLTNFQRWCVAHPASVLGDSC